MLLLFWHCRESVAFPGTRVFFFSRTDKGRPPGAHSYGKDGLDGAITKPPKQYPDALKAFPDKSTACRVLTCGRACPPETLGGVCMQLLWRVPRSAYFFWFDTLRIVNGSESNHGRSSKNSSTVFSTASVSVRHPHTNPLQSLLLLSMGTSAYQPSAS